MTSFKLFDTKECAYIRYLLIRKDGLTSIYESDFSDLLVEEGDLGTSLQQELHMSMAIGNCGKMQRRKSIFSILKMILFYRELNTQTLRYASILRCNS